MCRKHRPAAFGNSPELDCMEGSIFTDSARAKVNLTLRVLGRRADGYHELDSLVAFAEFCDDVA